MSVYVRSIVHDIGLTHSDVVSGKGSGWAVAQTSVQVLIGEDQEVQLDPVIKPTIPHPCDPAHAVVIGEKKPKGRRDRIASQSPLVYFVE